jgi:hypothetical protein
VWIEFVREETEREQKKKTQAAVVKKLLKNVEKKLGGEDVKATLGDYIRLVQLQQELEEDEPRDITVSWVEPASEK